MEGNSVTGGKIDLVLVTNLVEDGKPPRGKINSWLHRSAEVDVYLIGLSMVIIN